MLLYLIKLDGSQELIGSLPDISSWTYLLLVARLFFVNRLHGRARYPAYWVTMSSVTSQD